MAFPGIYCQNIQLSFEFLNYLRFVISKEEWNNRLSCNVSVTNIIDYIGFRKEKVIKTYYFYKKIEKVIGKDLKV